MAKSSACIVERVLTVPRVGDFEVETDPTIGGDTFFGPFVAVAGGHWRE